MIICPQCQALNDQRNTICIRCGASLIDDDVLGDPFVGRLLGRRFTLHEVIGSGEIGMVYRGIDDKTGQGVAVKIIHPDVAALHGDELLDWARRVAQIRHGKVAAMLGASRESDGTTYIVSELLEGETLRGLVERVGPLSPRRVADILFQLCNALAPIHKVDRPHANLKPENVFLIAGQQGDFVKITDTGSPALFGVHHTAQGRVVIGAAKYFSPEQARGDEVGLASDHFTLGVIGYQLLSGALPFFGATPDQLLDAIISNTPTPITERAPATPPDLAGVIERCMAKDPSGRYPDLRSLARDLAGVIKTRPAAPPKKTFGAGRDFSTVVARPDQLLPPLGPNEGFSAADSEATVMQEVPDDIQALLADDPVQPLTGEATPSPVDDLDLGLGGGDDLASALAAAAASVGASPPPRSRSAVVTPRTPGAGIRARQTAPRVSPPSRSSLAADDPLAAALAEAEAELDADGAPEAFDPFPDLDLDLGPPARPAPTPPAPARVKSTPVPGLPTPSAPPHTASAPLSSDDILSAIGEELGPSDVPKAVAPRPAASNPLATAADFASLSVPPRDPGHVSLRIPAVTGQIETAGARAPRSKAPLVILLVLLLGAGGAALWFFVLAPDDSGNGQAQRPETRQTTPAARSFSLVTDPAGATVYEQDRALGETPLVIEATGRRTLRFESAGRPDTPFVLDPAQIKAPADGPATVEVELAAAEVDDAGADAATAPDAGAEPQGAQGGQGGGDSGGQAGAGGGSGEASPRPPPGRRRTTRRRKPSVKDIRDPFANP